MSPKLEKSKMKGRKRTKMIAYTLITTNYYQMNEGDDTHDFKNINKFDT